MQNGFPVQVYDGATGAVRPALKLDLTGVTFDSTTKTFSAAAAPAPASSTYTLTIPSTVALANAGWNAADGISAVGSLASGKKLTVTAASGDEFALVSEGNKVAYRLAETGDTNTTYAGATAKTKWEFTALSQTATTQPMGVGLEDYSGKPAGTYTDTVNFTAEVEDVVLSGLFDKGARLTMSNFKFNDSPGHSCTITYNGSGFGIGVGGPKGDMAEKSVSVDGSKITVQVHCSEFYGSQWVFDTATDHYTYSHMGAYPGETSNCGSFLLNDQDITSQLTQD